VDLPAEGTGCDGYRQRTNVISIMHRTSVTYGDFQLALDRQLTNAVLISRRVPDTIDSWLTQNLVTTAGDSRPWRALVLISLA
jgi:hypothetical protein